MSAPAWTPGLCQVPMWRMGLPAGPCGEPANGPRLPRRLLLLDRGWGSGEVPYSFGPCCPNHGGPKAGEPILFQDGCTKEGRPMWCAVMPDFINLQESPAGFSSDPDAAKAALAKAGAA